MIHEQEFEQRWKDSLAFFTQLTGRKPDLNAILFLIGIRELGVGVREFSKEEKQDLMHIATCKLLALQGYYKLEGLDQDGWPHYSLEKPMPHMTLGEQEKMLKMLVCEYLENENSNL
jgi:hypothetical protein